MGVAPPGPVAPDAIQTHVKTCRGDMKNMHYIAPEYGNHHPVSEAVDIYSFGMCALEIAALEIPGNGDSGNHITQEQIDKTIHSIEHKAQQNFIRKCLSQDPKQRPDATKLLFDPVLFEVHSLKLLAANAIIQNPKKSNYMDKCLEKMLQKQRNSDVVVAEILHKDRDPTVFKIGQIPVAERLEKFMEDVRFGIYPLTAFKLPHLVRPRPMSPEAEGASSSKFPDEKDAEMRKIVNMICSVRPNEEGKGLYLTLSLLLDDKMNRQLSCVLNEEDRANNLADELVKFGFINLLDRDRVVCMIDSELTRFRNGGLVPEVNGEVYPANQHYGADPAAFRGTLPPISSR